MQLGKLTNARVLHIFSELLGFAWSCDRMNRSAALPDEREL
jgi:hypothetical protein